MTKSRPTPDPTQESQSLSLSRPPSAGFRDLNRRVLRPYAVLMIGAMVIIGLFVLVRVALDSAETRLAAQLELAAEQAETELNAISDAHGAVLTWLDLHGKDHMDAGDIDGLIGWLVDHNATASIERVALLDGEGRALLALEAGDNNADTRPRSFESWNGTVFEDLAVVRASFDEDSMPDHIVSMLSSDTDNDMYLFSVQPMHNQEGLALTATGTDELIDQLAAAAGTDLVLYGGPGYAVASTMPGWRAETHREIFTIDAFTYFGAMATAPDFDAFSIQPMEMDEREYRIQYVPMVVGGRTVGLLGVIVPARFFIPAALAESDTPFFLAFACVTSMFVLVGTYITVNMLQPMVSALDSEYAKSSTILTSIADGVIVRDTEGHILLANEPAQNMLTVDHKLELSPLEALFGSCMEGDCAEVEFQSGERTISASIAPMRGPEGTISGEVLLLRDVTARILTERTKSSFLAQIGHELRTPITVIKGYGDLLWRNAERMTFDMHQQATRSIVEHAETLSTMIDQMMDIAALQGGGLTLVHDELDLAELARDAAERLRPQFEESGLAVTVDATPEQMPVVGDRTRLPYLIEQLLLNAQRFSPDGGTVCIRVWQDGETVNLSVSDPGVGISEEDQAHLFESFFRGSPQDKAGNPIDVRGTGLGLYLVRQIVEAHGGSISVKSTLGEGSTFTARLPKP